MHDSRAQDKHMLNEPGTRQVPSTTTICRVSSWQHWHTDGALVNSLELLPQPRPLHQISSIVINNEIE